MNINSVAPAYASAKPVQPDFAAIKAKQQATWASGDFAVIGTTLQIVGEVLTEAADIGGANSLVVPAEYLEIVIVKL